MSTYENKSEEISGQTQSSLPGDEHRWIPNLFI
jgi:hypothetical protein